MGESLVGICVTHLPKDDELDEEAVRQQTSTSDAVPDTYGGYILPTWPRMIVGSLFDV